MSLNPSDCYQALKARDSRFDGHFFVGVTSTGIYCRPICPARTPAQTRCLFFPSAAQAETQGFRPCLRCRPELAPGHAPIDAASRIAKLALGKIRAGALSEGQSLEQLAQELGLSSRQLRRSVQQELGASPVELAQTQRLLLAKQLLTETHLPVTEVAYASGFSSLRRFNALFKERYGQNPSSLRRKNGQGPDGELCLTLSYRPPLAWQHLLDFLQGHALLGVEQVEGSIYRRTLRMGEHQGWVEVQPKAAGQLQLRLAQSLLPALPSVLAKMRALLDLDANALAIDEQLGTDPRLAPSVLERPGVRVPGCTDLFELAWRTILGQQVSVAAATRIAARTVEALGDPIATPFPGLLRLAPTAETFLQTQQEVLGTRGWIRSRSAAVSGLAAAWVDGSLSLKYGDDPEMAMKTLVKFPGIGPWTAGYIVMRGLGHSDGWPYGDAILKKHLANDGSPDPRWRPWSAYAAMRLWYPIERKDLR